MVHNKIRKKDTIRWKFLDESEDDTDEKTEEETEEETDTEPERLEELIEVTLPRRSTIQVSPSLEQQNSVQQNPEPIPRPENRQIQEQENVVSYETTRTNEPEYAASYQAQTQQTQQFQTNTTDGTLRPQRDFSPGINMEQFRRNNIDQVPKSQDDYYNTTIESNEEKRTLPFQRRQRGLFR